MFIKKKLYEVFFSMATNLIPKAKFESSGIVDSLLIGTIKAIEERALIPVVGNGTLTSGAVKLIGGGLAQSAVGGKFGKLVGSAFVIDGVEDVVNALVMPLIGGGGGNQAGNQAESW
jgi:Na+/citrate or Na+/malate symporter